MLLTYGMKQLHYPIKYIIKMRGWIKVFKLLNSFKNYPIIKKIFILSIGQVLIPILIIGAISLSISVKVINNLTMNYTQTVFHSISSKLVDYSNGILDISQELLYDNNIFNVVMMSATSTYPVGSQEKKQIHNSIRKLILSRQEIEAVSLQIRNEVFTTSKKEDNIYSPKSIGYIEIEKYAKTKNGKPFWYFNTSNNEIKDIFFARTINNPYTYQHEGLLILKVSQDIFKNLIQQYETKNAQSFFLVSQNKTCIYKSNFSDVQISPDDFLQISTNKKGIIRSKHHVIMYNHIPEMECYILCQINYLQLYKDSYYLILCIILLCFFSSVLLLLFTNYVQRNVCQPLHYLADYMDNWQENKKFINNNFKAKDEIGTLYNSFEKMTNRIISLINQNYRSEMALKEAELKMLQSQINPHFLFNTLESINSLAQLNEVPEISKMITSLADFFEQSIGRDDRFIPFDEEILHLDNYIYLFKVRFSNKFEVIKNIQDNTRPILIPRLILQPIVENAIHHGILPSEKKCILEITSKIVDNDLVVTISDDGVGMSKEEVDKLNAIFLTNTVSNHTSIGLINVNKRLKLLYGDDYSLKLESSQNLFTKVTVRFKIKNM